MNKMKNPELEVVRFGAGDVIATSATGAFYGLLDTPPNATKTFTFGFGKDYETAIAQKGGVVSTDVSLDGYLLDSTEIAYYNQYATRNGDKLTANSDGYTFEAFSNAQSCKFNGFDLAQWGEPTKFVYTNDLGWQVIKSN